VRVGEKQLEYLETWVLSRMVLILARDIALRLMALIAA
jgi:hypothetical protein